MAKKQVIHKKMRDKILCSKKGVQFCPNNSDKWAEVTCVFCRRRYGQPAVKPKGSK